MKKSADRIYLTTFNYILLFYRKYKLCKLCRKFQSARKILSKTKCPSRTLLEILIRNADRVR